MHTPHVRLSILAALALTLAGATALSAEEAAPRRDPAAAFFDEAVVHTAVLTFAPGDLAVLQAGAPPSRMRPPPRGPGVEGGPPERPPEPGAGEDDFDYVPASFTVDGGTPLAVQARWKGNSSWSWAQRHSKKSWKVDLDRAVEGQTLFGLDKLNLQNGAMDSTLMRESLAFECYRRFGVPASRTTFARVALAVEGGTEARDLGVYTVVEQVDGTFLKRVFGDDRGTLVKPERVGDRLGRAGEGVDGTVESLNVKRKGRAEDRARLAALVALLAEDPAARATDFPARLEALLDVEAFLRWWAMATLLGDVDTLAGFGHNAYLYVRPADGRVVLIPWDLNHAFGGMPMTPVAQSTDWSIEKPWTGSKRLFEHVLATPAWKARFRALLSEAMEGPFSVAAVKAAVERRAAALRPGFAEPEIRLTKEHWEKSLTADVERARPGGDGAAPRPGPPHGGEEPGLVSFVERRCASVKAQLAGERAGTVIEGGPPGRRGAGAARPDGPRPPPPPGDAPR